jgi:hypothetical protein
MLRNRAWLRRAVESINLCLFAGDDVQCTVAWQRWDAWRTAYAVAHVEDRVIRVNRVLAWPAVPDYAVVHVLYHEMLHVRLGSEHDERFVLAEKQAPHFTDFMRWDAYHGLAALALPRPAWDLIR